MTSSGNKKSNIKNSKDLDQDQICHLIDPEYKRLLNLFQSAKFSECEDLILRLIEKYPGNNELERFKSDLYLKLSFKDSIDSATRDERKNQRTKKIKLSLFAIAATLVILGFALFVSFLIQINQDTKQLNEDYSLLSSLEYQAVQLLNAGKPQHAAGIVETMKAVGVDYENLPQLIAETEALLQLEINFQIALDLNAQGQETEALEMLRVIEVERPAMWDVRNKIEMIETNINLKLLTDEGNRSFDVQDWDGVINAYESIQSIDQNYASYTLKEQLFQAYLNRIFDLIENKEATIEDIFTAENYYRKATTLVFQSQAFANERERLQQVCNDLFQAKNTQVAKATFGDKTQTFTSIAEAVSIFRKAVDVDPKNKALSADLKNAEYYQTAFRKFQDMQWDEVVSNLKLILADDPDFADGNADVLLFEAYYALAKQYYGVGLYLDSIQALQQAEIIVFSDTNNLLKLFQVQTFLGNTFGKLNNFEDAVSYYKYAFEAINAQAQLGEYPDLDNKLSEANMEATQLDFEKAFHLYEEVLEEIDVIYAKPEIQVGDSVCLAFVADENRSTLDAILVANNLPSSTTLFFGRTLIVPKIEK